MTEVHCIDKEIKKKKKTAKENILTIKQNHLKGLVFVSLYIKTENITCGD